MVLSRISRVLRADRFSVTAVVIIAIAAFTLQLGGTSSKAEAADDGPFAPDTCRLLSAAEASQLLRLPSSSQAFTDLGFPVSRTAARNPSYSQCRFTSTSSQSQIRLIVNADLAKAPSLRIEAIAAKTQPGARILTIDRALTVWRPWTQQDLRGQGGVLSSAKDGDYIAVVLVDVHRDPLRAAEDAMRVVLPRISSSR
jgi:hypothetical protein